MQTIVMRDNRKRGQFLWLLGGGNQPSQHVRHLSSAENERHVKTISVFVVGVVAAVVLAIIAYQPERLYFNRRVHHVITRCLLRRYYRMKMLVASFTNSLIPNSR